ncbi:tRNA-2-methylthio-N(6)-dimethylallyladenosine synthase [Candidatus Bilamarchaeum dharawalense]|uniref:tRNA-t(6)A37 methylthiotransferase n=1 Tax=Candidatus Bilamarchaeum dharawalense TaxID=2885759 RepID=A0A5E4LQI4_9ARCH|nr:tRNA-2-methylthio-N(6)-dimethylallyladenosine synthase [Candidatus Bilamarchaeum dharawalense]
MLKVFVKTYGCTLNQADSDILKAIISEKYELVEREEESDVVVLNTCTVKGATDNKIFAKIRLLENSGRKFVVAGCLTVNEAKIRQIAPHKPILGTSALRHINEAVEDALAERAATYRDYESKDSLPKILGAPIARIPINDGCVSKCAFCQTKLARPYLRSYSPKTVVNWINASVKNGAKEIQLTSQDAGAYGIDIKTNLISLLEAILNDNSSTKANEEFFIRLGMINPDHVKRMLPDLLKKMENKKIYKFLHIPVQSGSEKVCKDMNRDHTVQDFVDIVTAVRKKFPEVTIATDIIVGYPTETKKDFEDTLELLKTTKPDITNISRFSPRPGTKAKELKQLNTVEMKKRTGQISTLVRELNIESRRRFIGKTYPVLITEKQRDFTGRNINYTQVVVKGFQGKLGDFVTINIIDANHGSLFGEICQ